MESVRNMRILAIDPGETNGVAAYINGKYITTIIKNPTDFYQFFHGGLDAVVIEQFAASVISKHGLHTVRMVGGIEALCGYLNIPLKHQTPQERIAFIDFARRLVRKQDTYISVGDRHHHQVDALAHLLRYQNDICSIRIKGDDLVTIDGSKVIVSL